MFVPLKLNFRPVITTFFKKVKNGMGVLLGFCVIAVKT